MNVVCIGSGYVGSVTCAAFAALGHKATTIDIDPKKIEMMNAGKSPIFEPGLDEVIAKHVGKTLFATTSYEVVKEADVVFICVGTPSHADGTADLKYIEIAAKNVGENLNKDRFTVIVDKSTVPVGTAELVTKIVAEASCLSAEESFSVVSNPEFLREGFALEDVFFPDRVVIGSSNERAKQVMRQLYHPLLERVNYGEIRQMFKGSDEKPLYFETDTKSAEMIKYASNAFLAVKISYINEVARLCEALDANVLDVAYGIGLDKRIGNRFLEVSSGWSGSCFPKDTAEFLATSIKAGSELGIVSAAVTSNEMQHQYMVDKVERKLGSLQGKKIGILGLTFKPNTDDARKTQAAYIIDQFVKAGATVQAHDPEGVEQFTLYHGHLPVTFVENAEDVAQEADALVLLTHWAEYKYLDYAGMVKTMKQAYIMDSRNFLDRAALLAVGYCYEGLGVSGK